MWCLALPLDWFLVLKDYYVIKVRIRGMIGKLNKNISRTFWGGIKFWDWKRKGWHYSKWRNKGAMVNELKHASLFFPSLLLSVIIHCLSANYILFCCPHTSFLATDILPEVFSRSDFIIMFLSREVFNTCSRTVLMPVRPVDLNEMVKLYHWSQIQWWGTIIWQCCHCSKPCFLTATFLDLNNFLDDRSNCITYLYQLKFAFG